jgi:hypothetical protein
MMNQLGVVFDSRARADALKRTDQPVRSTTVRWPGAVWVRRLLRVLLAVASLAPLAWAAGDPSSTVQASGAGPHSPKKGLGIGIRKTEDWQQRLTLVNVAWFYTWRSEHPGSVPGDVEFVPMVWGARAVSAASIAELKRGREAGRYRTLLGFNEPDARTQANMQFEAAVKLWPLLASTGLRLGSPATVNAHIPWMRAFVAGVERDGGRVDFIAVHWYGGPDPEKFLKHLAYVHQRYGRPLWITEFAVADWKARASGVSRFTPEQALSFMSAVLPALERLDYVERYAWFSASPDNPALGHSTLFHRDGSLTPLGRSYAEY